MNLETYKTERLILRKLIPSDFIYIFENYSQTEIRTVLGINSDSEYLIEENKYNNGYSTYNRTFVLFQLIDKFNEQIIGRCGLHNWCIDHKRAEIGYILKVESYKGKGLMTEALTFIIDYGFKNMDLNRIEAITRPSNVASLKLISKFNFTQEGYLRQHYIQEGKLEDSLVFALLKEEYKSLK